jgi:hypothetical protein
MQGFNRIVKQAYAMKLLRVGAYNDETVVVTPRCYFSVTETHQPNKFKAIVTEHLGHMPAEDPTTSNLGFVEVGKEYSRDLETKEATRIVEEVFTKRRLQAYRRTPVSIIERGSTIRLLQSTTDSKIIGVCQDYLDLVDYKQLDYDYEGEPCDPAVDEALQLVYITNDTTSLVIQASLISGDRAKEVIELIQLIDFNKREGI